MSLEFRGEVWIRDTRLGEVSIEMDLKLDRMRLPRENREGKISVDCLLGHPNIEKSAKTIKDFHFA